jgi:hypothetical protein
MAARLIFEQMYSVFRDFLQQIGRRTHIVD